MPASVNVAPSQIFPNLGAISPVSMTGGATAASGWVDVGTGFWIQGIVHIGAGVGTITATWEQATSSAGAGAKALSGGAFASTAYVNTPNTVNNIEDKPEQLDVANAFRFVRLTLTQSVATTLAAAQIKVGPPRFETAVSPAS